MTDNKGRQHFPVATIAVPTRNRLEGLRSAAASALVQDYPNLEVLIVDNASEDGTREWCDATGKDEPRLRYIRQQEPVDILSNFEAGFALSRGHYFMWLADDDRLEPNYLTECIRLLEADPECVVAGGVATMHRKDGTYVTDAETVVLARRPDDRVVEFLDSVKFNSIFYGVHRREVLGRILPMPRVIACDWVTMARCAAYGTLRTTASTAIRRSLRTPPRDLTATARTFGHGRIASRVPLMTLTLVVPREVLRLPVISTLSRTRRAQLAFRCGFTLGWRRLITRRIRGGITRLSRRRRQLSPNAHTPLRSAS